MEKGGAERRARGPSKLRRRCGLGPIHAFEIVNGAAGKFLKRLHCTGHRESRLIDLAICLNILGGGVLPLCISSFFGRGFLFKVMMMNQ